MSVAIRNSQLRKYVISFLIFVNISLSLSVAPLKIIDENLKAYNVVICINPYVLST